MFPLDFSSQDSCDNAAIFGGVMVVIGVTLEAVDLIGKFKGRNKSILHKESTGLLWVESASISLVVLGLWLEIFATHKSSVFARQKSDELQKQTTVAVDRAGEAGNEAAKANLQGIVLSNETVRLSVNLESAKSNNLELARQVFGLVDQTKQIITNMAQVRDMVNSPEITAKIDAAKKSLIEVNKKIDEVRDALTNSSLSELRKLKPFKQRLIDCLNSMDANILPRLSGLPSSLTVSAEYDSSKVDELKNLAEEPGAWEYVQIIEEKEHNFHWVFQGKLESCKFALYPALLKK